MSNLRELYEAAGVPIDARDARDRVIERQLDRIRGLLIALKAIRAASTLDAARDIAERHLSDDPENFGTALS